MCLRQHTDTSQGRQEVMRPAVWHGLQGSPGSGDSKMGVEATGTAFRDLNALKPWVAWLSAVGG